MKKKTKIILIVILAIVILFAAFILYLNKPTKSVNSDDIYNCNRDIDCVSFQAGCCNCRNGGTNIALNRKYLDYWVEELSRECREVVCTAVISDDWTCLAAPKCIDSNCQLVK